MLYLVSTVIAAVFLGRGPALLTSILGVLAFDFFLVPPYMTLAVTDTQYILTFIGLFIVSLVISTLTVRTREQAEAAIQREAHTSALYTLGRDLTSATDLNQVAEIIISHIGQVFGRDVAIFLPDNGRLKVFATTPNYFPDENEMAVATWAFDHDQPAGMGTDTLPAASIRCQPSKDRTGHNWSARYSSQETGKLLTPSNVRLSMPLPIRLPWQSSVQASQNRHARLTYCKQPKNYKPHCSTPSLMICARRWSASPEH